MKLESIFELWEKDSHIDNQKIDDESLKISNLHKKYHEIYTNERLLMRKYETDLKTLRLDKFEFFTQGPTKETHEKGWRLPACGKVLKSEAQTYIDADQDVIDLTLKIGIQQEKVELLKSIINVVMNRGYSLKTALDFLKFQAGF